MNPTVSVTRNGRPSRRMTRVVGSSVWKSRSWIPTSAPVSAVQQRRLPGVRVSGDRDPRQPGPLALGAHRLARALDVGQPPLERGDPVAGQPAVGLDLRLAGAARADAAAEALEVGPQAAHAGEVVLELGELDLELAVGAVGVTGEDVEDDRRAVDDGDAELRLEVALLARAELVVAGDDVRVGRLGERLDLDRACPGPGRCSGGASRDAGRPVRRRRRRPCAAARAARAGRHPPRARRCRTRAAWRDPSRGVSAAERDSVTRPWRLRCCTRGPSLVRRAARTGVA